jgi:Holliday junction resolvase-like predicted endonuclease
MLRLLERGDRVEERIVADLTAAGLRVTNQQSRVTWGQFSGSIDGIVHGLPDLPSGVTAVLECKSSNRKGFERLIASHCYAEKRQHWSQCQTYMHGMGLKWALYVVECKDDDRRYAELIPFDQNAGEELEARAFQLMDSDLPPPPVKDAGQAPCTFVAKTGEVFRCQFFGLCHGEQMPERSCRTCLNATSNGQSWRCRLGEIDAPALTTDEQKAGCTKYQVRPDFHRASIVRVLPDDVIEYQFPSGKIVRGDGK